MITNGVWALLLGLVVALLLLAPTAAVQYRRDGRLGPGDLATLVGAAVYGLALWTYTLLPLPGPEFRCKPVRLDVRESLAPIVRRGLLPLEQLLQQAAFQQLALNVVLFVPLGFFVRWVIHRGVLTTMLLGAGLSAAIEVTQVTGVWGLYRCAYRTFDVDDLITNVLGAVIGGVVAWVLIHPDRDVPERLPTRLTLGRRWVGFASDVIVMVVLTGFTGAVLRWFTAYDALPLGVLLTPALMVQSLAIGLYGRTLGEWAISVKAVARRLPTPLARLVKAVAGVGAFVLLAVPNLWLGGALLGLWVLATLVASVVTRGHRGLTHWLAGMDLVIER